MRFPVEPRSVGPPFPAFFVAVALALTPTSSAAQGSLCDRAYRFLAETMGMAAVVAADTVDDWRTDRVTPGCRVTAAGITELDLRTRARTFFERLREAGWTRTPDPRDAPNEASLRFRMDATDCLFSFYSGGLLGTDDEARVDDAAVPGPGQRRFNYLVQCVPAAPAASG